jgi:hypothetical protein
MTYQIIITEEVANVAVTSDSYPIIINYNATNFSDTNTYGNANVAAYLASGTNASIIDLLRQNTEALKQNAAGYTSLSQSINGLTVNATTERNEIIKAVQGLNMDDVRAEIEKQNQQAQQQNP